MKNRDLIRNKTFFRFPFAIVLAFCCIIPVSCFEINGPVNSMEVLTSNSWMLREMNAREISMGDFEKGVPYLKFHTDGKMKIFTGSDYIDGTFRTSGSLLWMSFDTSNRCKGDLVSNFLNNLKTSNTYKTKLERLILIRDKDEMMYFFPK